MKLIDPSDDALNEAFAVHVAGWILDTDKPGYGVSPTGATWIKQLPSFTTSADSVLPWLEKAGGFAIYTHDPKMMNRYTYSVVIGEQNYAHLGDALARTLVLALLRSKGVEIEFTK